MPKIGPSGLGPAASADRTTADDHVEASPPLLEPFAPLPVGVSSQALGSAPAIGSDEVAVRVRQKRIPADTWQVSAGDTIESIFAALVAEGASIDRADLERRVRIRHPGIDLQRLTPGMTLSFEAAPARAPTAAELIASPIVRKAIEAAWVDSNTSDPATRHEEGGWIYMNVATAELFVKRAISGAQASIDLSAPIQIDGAVVVGTFHTHPNPSADHWDPGPSASDRSMEMSRGTPGIIRNDQGYTPYGWTQRASLEGSWAYPGTPERPLS